MTSKQREYLMFFRRHVLSKFNNSLWSKFFLFLFHLSYSTCLMELQSNSDNDRVSGKNIINEQNWINPLSAFPVNIKFEFLDPERKCFTKRKSTLWTFSNDLADARRSGLKGAYNNSLMKNILDGSTISGEQKTT